MQVEPSLQRAVHWPSHYRASVRPLVGILKAVLISVLQFSPQSDFRSKQVLYPQLWGGGKKLSPPIKPATSSWPCSVPSPEKVLCTSVWNGSENTKSLSSPCYKWWGAQRIKQTTKQILGKQDSKSFFPSLTNDVAICWSQLNWMNWDLAGEAREVRDVAKIRMSLRVEGQGSVIYK